MNAHVGSHLIRRVAVLAGQPIDAVPDMGDSSSFRLPDSPETHTCPPRPATTSGAIILWPGRDGWDSVQLSPLQLTAMVHIGDGEDRLGDEVKILFDRPAVDAGGYDWVALFLLMDMVGLGSDGSTNARNKAYTTDGIPGPGQELQPGPESGAPVLQGGGEGDAALYTAVIVIVSAIVVVSMLLARRQV